MLRQCELIDNKKRGQEIKRCHNKGGERMEQTVTINKYKQCT